jgi:hypothetical protein
MVYITSNIINTDLYSIIPRTLFNVKFYNTYLVIFSLEIRFRISIKADFYKPLFSLFISFSLPIITSLFKIATSLIITSFFFIASIWPSAPF